MFSSLIRKAMSLLLATMLVTITIAPPAIRHAHPPADEGHGHHHHHHSSPDGLHEHSHHGGYRSHDLADVPGGDAQWSGDHGSHLHVHFLFFDFTLPDPAPDQHDPESYSRDVVSVLSWSQVAVSWKALQNASIWQTILPFHAVSLEDAALLQVVVTAPPPVSNPPLCDRARRERSGVLVA